MSSSINRIIGMTKSCLDLKGAKRQKVELDFLRLVYVISRTENCLGYMLVFDQNIKNVIENDWMNKYEIKDYSNIEVLTINDLNKNFDTTNLFQEKELNKIGNQTSNVIKSNASGLIGMESFERLLRNYIETEYKDFKNITTENFHGISWDAHYEKV